MLGMGWVLSMAVVEGLSAHEVAGRLAVELGEETISDSPGGEEAGAGPGLPAVGVHGDGRAVILDEPYADAPILEDGRLLGRLSRGTRVVLFQLSLAGSAGGGAVCLPYRHPLRPGWLVVGPPVSGAQAHRSSPRLR
jgi:hypothetical protein